MPNNPKHIELEKRVKEIEKELLQHKRAQETLRESEEKYRHITETITDYIYSVRVEAGQPVETIHDPACLAVTGYTAQEFKANPYLWMQIVHEEDRGALQEQAKSTLSRKKVGALEHRFVRKDGALRWIRHTPVPHFDSQGRLLSYDGLIQDITEQKRLEAQRQQVTKMDAIGTLAGGIAHDFNNLLMGIKGDVSLMLLDLDSTYPHYKRLKRIDKQIQSGAKLTSRLLGFARKGRYEIKPLDLNRLVEDISDSFSQTRTDITIHKDLAKDLFGIEADPVQLEQAFLNLLENASDAMPDGGNIILKTMNTTHRALTSNMYNAKPGNYIMLSISDTGTGMDTEIKNHIFEPFYTTKEMGYGTGLGLASVYGTIKGHDGYIEVDSNIGEGTTFSIYFPASEKKVGEVIKKDKAFIRGTETILLVEDEKVNREVAKEFLEVMGYRVLTAKNGKEGIDVYTKNQYEIDVVIMDMIMPKMGGGEAYDRMKKINPEIKVLLSSGYSVDGKAKKILDRGCNGFIQKPYSIKKLSATIKNVLNDQDPQKVITS